MRRRNSKSSFGGPQIYASEVVFRVAQVVEASSSPGFVGDSEDIGRSGMVSCEII